MLPSRSIVLALIRQKDRHTDKTKKIEIVVVVVKGGGVA